MSEMTVDMRDGLVVGLMVGGVVCAMEFLIGYYAGPFDPSASVYYTNGMLSTFGNVAIALLTVGSGWSFINLIRRTAPLTRRVRVVRRRIPWCGAEEE